MTSQPNVINDLSSYTKIPNKILQELVHKLNLCIGSAIHDAIINKEPAVVINVGIGSLSVNLADMQCKFIPSKDLKTCIKNSIESKVDPVEFAWEQALVDKLLAISEEAI